VDLSFNAGWNIFSSAISPDSADIQYNFHPLIDNSSLAKIQDETGMALENWEALGGWQNDIGDISPSEGYKVKVNSYSELELCGTPVNYPYGIYLKEGWNIMGYPHLQTVDAMEVVQQMIDMGWLEKVQDEKGQSIENLGIYGGWQNFIGNMSPGEGYKIKVNSADTLWIEASYPKSLAIVPEKASLQHFKPVFTGNGVDHMNVNLVGLSSEMLNAGDEIAVYDGPNRVGAAAITRDHLNNGLVSIIASATDDSGMHGFTEGNQYHLRLWNAVQNREVEIEAEYISGPEQFTKHESVVLSLEKSALTDIEDGFSTGLNEVKCYPNPFAEAITIELNLAADAEVNIEVINQFGQQVKTIASKQQLNSGIHRLNWDGTNASGSRVSHGIYYLRFEINDNVLHKKVVVSK
jgi:hypothetical protein